MIRSKEKLTVIFLSVLLCSLFSLIGCKDAEKEQAVAEAAETKIELTKVKALLAGATSDLDGLKLKMATVVEARDKLQTALEQAGKIKDQLAGLTEQRDAAIAKATEAQGLVEKLKGQLAEQVKKAVGLESQNKKLQEMLGELKKSIGTEAEIPSIPGL